MNIHTFACLGIRKYELGNYEQAVFEFKSALIQYKYTPKSHFGIAKPFQNLVKIKKLLRIF